jgi:nicotinic acid mononucleotide adenylyltransferase
MRLLVEPRPAPRTLGILAGSFHPVTRAHMALARAGLAQLDAVVLAMPERFPHKSYEGVGLEARLEILVAALDDPRLGLAVTEGGLFREMADEARRHWPECEVWMMCGRDAAERICSWAYSGLPIEEQLREYGLLVAARQGDFEPPPHLAGRVRTLGIEAGWDDVSATEARERIARGGDWESLVPESAVDLVRRHYSSSSHSAR